MKKLLLALVAVAILAGCSTRYSTLEPESGIKATAYQGDIDEMMKDLHLGMVCAFPGRNLTRVDEAGVKGYTTWTRVLLDTYTQQAIFIPVKGIALDGAEVDAYAFEVSGSGTDGIGMSRNTSLYKDVKAVLDRKYPVATVK